MIKRIIGKLGLFISCGYIYYCIEILFRGYSHFSMFLLAGFIGVFCIDSINNIFTFDLDYLLQVIISTVLCTLCEGICGLIVNVWLKLNVWDYSDLIGTFFFGQCNIFFCIGWFLIIGLFAIFYCDFYNYYILKEDPQPYYKIFGKEFLRFKKRKD